MRVIPEKFLLYEIAVKCSVIHFNDLVEMWLEERIRSTAY